MSEKNRRMGTDHDSPVDSVLPLAGEGPSRPGRHGWLAGGGLIGALLASTCCVLPFVLFSLGVGGAWTGQLTALAPYQPWFWAVGTMFVVAGLVSVWRGRRACRVNGGCSPSRAQRIAHPALWPAAALLAVSALWPVILPILVD
jgi:mercuric ion transport protein